MEEVVNKSKEDKYFIAGVAILRFFMCFMVVCNHFVYKTLFDLGGLFYVFQPFHVPVFMLLSFLLCSKYFLEPTKERTGKRMLRMLIPFVTWGIVGFLLSLIIWPNLSFEAFVWQIFTGAPVNVSLWFLAVMIWISAIFWWLRYISNKKVFLVLISVISVVCIVSQYTGLNTHIFDMAPYSLRISFGRLAEMIPYATAGILLSYAVPYLSKLKYRYQLIMFLSTGVIMVAALLIKTQLVSYQVRGYDYPGLYRLCMAALLVLTAYTSPINLIKNVKFKTVIKWITSFTMGIFCIHLVIGRFLEWEFIALKWPTQNIVIALIIYLICYLISFLIHLIPNKYVRQLVN